MNRRAEDGGNPQARSRGLLCLDAPFGEFEAAEFASRERGSDYNPFNLLMVSRTEAFVAYNRGASIEVVEIKPGLHLLSNLDLNDFECPKISASYGKFAELGNREDFQRDPIGHRAAWGPCWQIITRNLMRDRDGLMRCVCISIIMGLGRRV